MGYSSYSSSNRLVRADNLGYFHKNVNDIFTQNKVQRIHESMDPNGVVVREARDSDAHPNTIPIQLYLDVTGSMGHIPHEMIKDGLPILMGSLIQNGVVDATLLFGAIGDHECDNYPLQIGQFESGDAELDMWLTRTYIEGNGGGNAGESYLLAWYFASHYIKTDAYDKRNTKGFVFTIGDEPCLRNLPICSIKNLMGNSIIEQEGSFTREQLLDMAKVENHVYHIHILHGRNCDSSWKELLGDNLIILEDYKNISRIISDIILLNTKHNSTSQTNPSSNSTEDGGIVKPNILL